MKPLITLFMPLLLSTAAYSKDPAMQVIEETEVENLVKNPTPKLDSLFGAGIRIGLPHPLNISAQYYDSSRAWSAELSAGSTGLTYQSADVKIDNYELSFRWHPSRNPFYIGLGYGNQNIEIKDSDFISGQAVSGKLKVESKYLKPAIGWIWMRKNSQFYWGMELGWQFPSDNKTIVTTSHNLAGDPDYDKFIKDINDIGDQLGESAVPNVGLIKLGWYF